MQKLSGLMFCIASLAMVAGLAWLLFPYAALSKEEVRLAITPQDSEMFEDVDMGDFGSVPVFEMMQHYIDSPPAEADGKKVRFQGC